MPPNKDNNVPSNTKSNVASNNIPLNNDAVKNVSSNTKGNASSSTLETSSSIEEGVILKQMFEEDNKLCFIVKWKNMSEPQIVDSRTMFKDHPTMINKFYAKQIRGK